MRPVPRDSRKFIPSLRWIEQRMHVRAFANYKSEIIRPRLRFGVIHPIGIPIFLGGSPDKAKAVWSFD